VELTARNMTANSVTTLMNRSSLGACEDFAVWRALQPLVPVPLIVSSAGTLGLYPGTSLQATCWRYCFNGGYRFLRRRWTGRLEGGRAMKSAEEPACLPKWGRDVQTRSPFSSRPSTSQLRPILRSISTLGRPKRRVYLQCRFHPHD
jgi:hypothetical protein